MSTEDNIVKLPDLLERRALKIEAAMARRATADEEWNEGTLELAIELAGARADHGEDDKAFGQWLDGRFGNRAPSHQDRAVLIKWGSEPAHTRTVLEKTESRSIRLIHQNEWTFTSAGKGPPPKPRAHEVEEFIAASKAETGIWPKRKSVAAAMGVHPRTVDNASRAVKAADAANSAGVGKHSYTKAQEHQLQTRLKVLEKSLEAQFQERVRKAAQELYDQNFPTLQKEKNEAHQEMMFYRKLIDNHKPIFSEAEYRDLLLCTHESNPSPETRKRAFMALNAKKSQLTGKRP